MTIDIKDTKPSKKKSPAKGDAPSSEKTQSKKPDGRKNKPSPKGQRACTLEGALEIINIIETEGLSYRKACEKANYNQGSAWAIIHADTELDRRYARAREASGVMFAGNIIEVADGVLTGKYKPDAARVAMDGYKWVGARFAPGLLGDKVSHEHGGTGGGPIKHGVTVLTAAQMAALSEEQIKTMMEIGEILFPAAQPGGDSNEK